MAKIILKYLVNVLIKPVVLLYLSRERNYRYDDIYLIIKPGVFHPGFFFSTKLLLDYLKNIPLQNRAFLELGAGSGLISIYAARQKAIVTATDISQTAIETIQQNAKVNDVHIDVMKSNLFEALPRQSFDMIIINPPYYPGNPAKDEDFAWYCGRNFEYFEKLFSQIMDYVDPNSEIYMILSEVCQIERIRQIALKNNWGMETVYQKRVLWEENFIFKLIPVKTEID